MGEEREVKFFLQDLEGMRERLLAAGGVIAHVRVFESNARFDTPDGQLTAARRVLRLRQDARVRLTYKSPAPGDESISVRQELEVTVSDYNEMHAILSALGYMVSILYEKYRTTYQFNGVEIVLDEMPYGNFMEIEGPDAGSIREAAEQLGLNWEARCTVNYLVLFDRLRSRGLSAEHLTFDLLAGRTFKAEDFDLKPGDRSVHTGI
jgi:adenylate cyclase class 2